MKDSKIPVIAVCGPTASGKTDLAMVIAARFQGEIVNCDSVQMYRGLDIGTAKPGPAEMTAIPHHLFDILEPEDIFNAGDYAVAARECIRDIHKRGSLAILTGGTGFYLRALFEGLAPGPKRNDALRARLAEGEARRTGYLTRLLRRLDPLAAKRIHENDQNKLIRAVEICLSSQSSTAQIFSKGRDAFEDAIPLKLVLNPPRELLIERISARTLRMFQGGLLSEVQGLRDRGISKEAKAFESIGYWQACEVLEGRMTEDDAIESVQVATRQYAKRQLTWFRRERDVKWLEGFGDSLEVQQLSTDLVRDFLTQFTVGNQKSSRNPGRIEPAGNSQDLL